jgi:tetratricopeptide (TPR) repeat protein
MIALKASPHVSWRRATLGGMAAIGVFIGVIGLFMLLRALGIGPAGSLLAAGKLTAREPVIIADFAVTNTDSALGATVSYLVREGLSQSSAISLVSPARMADELQRMQRPRTTRVDSALARMIAQRQGVKAVVAGNVTDVSGGYIVTLQLVSADSGIELTSFREAGDGPRGLIDAADKLARDLRGKIGESLRSVQATPPLADVTTASLDALKKYSAALRANNVEGQFAKAVALLREAVAIDSTFASAWRLLAIAMNNALMPLAPRDSALERAFRYSKRLPEVERLYTVATYYWSGPHRDRAKAAAAFEAADQRMGIEGDNNLSLILAYRGQYARAESMNLRVIARDSSLSLAYGNAANRELDQGKIKEAEAMLALVRRRFPGNSESRPFLSLLYARGQLDEAERYADSARHGRDAVQRAHAAGQKSRLALLRGRYNEWRRLTRESQDGYRDQGIARVLLTDSVDVLSTYAWFHGPSERSVAALDATLKALPLSAIAAADRPYFGAATAYARAGRPDKARDILDQRRREIRDTALFRIQQPFLHTALAEIALAEHKPLVAVAEFRQGDVDPSDGSHATQCGVVCLSFNLGRAFDAAEMPDSAIAMYERYIATPNAIRWETIDYLALAGAQKRLGELYEAKGERQKAALHYMRFVELWTNADPEFQPRVAEVKRRLALLADTEKR